MPNQQVFATKSNLLATRKTLDLSSLGFDLLDRKRNVLIRELMQRVDDAKALKDEVATTFNQAYFALQQANMSLGVVENLVGSIPIDESVALTSRSVMGVEIPHVTYAGQDPGPVYGFEMSNSKFDDAFRKFQKVKELCVRLAEVENSVYRLAGAIRKTQKRANALEHIIIPNLKATEKAITEALEEKDREEFSRLKVIKAQKERAKEESHRSSNRKKLCHLSTDGRAFFICEHLFSPAPCTFSALLRPCAKAAASSCKAVHKKTNISSNKGLFFTVLSSWSGLILSARSKVGGGGPCGMRRNSRSAAGSAAAYLPKIPVPGLHGGSAHPARSPRRRGDRQRCHQQVLTAPQKHDSNRASIKSYVAVIARSRARNRLVTLPRQETPVADPAATSPPD